jgi:hypothetical protein
MLAAERKADGPAAERPNTVAERRRVFVPELVA